MESLTFFRSTPAVINRKMYCIRNLNKRNRYAGYRFCPDYGDIPCGVIRDNGPSLPVLNNRGNAYATRNRNRFFKKPCKFKGFKEF